MRRNASGLVRIAAQIGAVALIGSSLLMGSASAFGAASGTLDFSLNPDTTTMRPGSSTTVTVGTPTRRSRPRR
jgi:hypothetical protein